MQICKHIIQVDIYFDQKKLSFHLFILFALKRSCCSNEEEMVIAFDPPHVALPAGGGTASSNSIKNEGVARMAFKIKSSNNAHYRVKPVYGFVDAGQSVAVEIVRNVSLFFLYIHLPPSLSH